jgi:pesticin/yersiniabactin receptor
MNYVLGDLKFSSISSYQDVSYDRDLFGGLYPESKKTFSQELKLALIGEGPVKGVFGVYFQDDEFTRDENGNSISSNKVEGRSMALFGETTWQLTDRIDLTGGLRYAYDEAKIDYDGAMYGAYPYISAFSNDADFTSLQPKFSVGFQLHENARIYGLVSKGYKPGGFNHAVASAQDINPYDAENSTNYEIGLKTSLLDNSFSVSVTGYYIEAEDKQIYVGPVGSQVIRNAGESTSKGVEIEASWQATNALTLTGSFMFGESTFDDYVDPLTSADYSGNHIPYAPDSTANFQVRYLLEQNIVPADVTLTGSLHYTDKVYFNEANSLSETAFTTYDAAIEMAFDNGLALKLFGTNLTDEVYRTSSFDFGGGTVLSTIGGGRVVGVSLSGKF